MERYAGFILQNTAPAGVKRIGVYNDQEKRVGVVKLGGLAKAKGKKLYSFGAISDVHLPVADSERDFIRALDDLDRSGVAFTCICGDLTNNGSDTQLARYQELVDTNARTPVYAVTGNHDTYTYNADIESRIATYTGNPLYYAFTQGEDVFIMLGIKSEGELFTDAELNWFAETLEANRNKRCFVFQHCFPGLEREPVCGNAGGLYHNYCWSGQGRPQLEQFKALLAKYKNTVFFHGHSHLKFRLQEGWPYANLDDSQGYRSIHIPSVSRPRQEDGSDEDTSADYDDAGSEGYVVDVYEHAIHLRGRDFAKETCIPLASYWLDTTLVNLGENTTAELGLAKLGTMKLGG